MVEFVTLLLGALVTGPTPIELTVPSEVTTVEIRLDDQLKGRVNGPPWELEVDFGEALLPHRLEAIAFAADGSKVGRARQWINLTPKEAEITISIDRNQPNGTIEAHLSWQSLSEDNEPVRTIALFDGEPLEVSDPRVIELPTRDFEQLHHLAVEIEFENSRKATAEMTFGGEYGDQIESGLTAFPVLLENPGDLPAADRIQDWFLSDGRPLTVHSVHEGLAEIIVVRSPEARRLLAQMVPPGGGPRFPMLRKDHRLRVLGIKPTVVDREVSDFIVFPRSHELKVRITGLLKVLANVGFYQRPPEVGSLADAVAVAGLSANGSARRRAVVLITTETSRDASRFAPERVRTYLASLGVPLFVWTPEKGGTGAGRWGTATNISTISRLDGAYRELTRSLDRQRIIWFTGLHLPQSIVLDREVEDLAAVR